MRRLIAAFALALALVLPVAAQTLDEGVAKFGSTKFDDIEAGIAAVAASGSPRATTILDALGAGELLFKPGGSEVYIKQADGSLVAAATGEAAPADLMASALKPVRVNNRIRRAIEAATGNLTLMSPDPKRRLEAAQAVFRSRDVTALPTLEQAFAAEQDPTVKRALDEARAAILLPMPGAADPIRLAAIDTLRSRGDTEALAILTAVPETAPPAVHDAAAAAAASIERHLSLIAAAQNVLFGISLGSVLLLAAIGLAITFGVMGVINMAHGEMVMLGAYTTFVIQEFCRTSFPAGLEWSLLVAVPAAFLVAGAMGVLIERTVIVRLYGRPLETLLATWGVSLILQQLVRNIFGPNNREVSTPSWMSGSVELMGFSITESRLVIVIFCLVVFAALLAVIRYTHFGLQMRAVTQNRRMAAAMGIRTAWVDAMTFGLGSGVAGIAGVALSQIDNVSPNLGQSYIIDSFMVVVFGGVGNLWGTFTGAFTLGIVNKLLEPTVGAVLGKILVLVAIILFIQKRPRGLFALKGRAVEA
ncbi:MAG: urea ABC transporter permease subunit UrtB [Geminicoccaceae bacterium]